jgi:hypothetical protein
MAIDYPLKRMLYIAYLDEFGHIGPYVSKEDPSHNTHPVFGLAGVVLPYGEVRRFATYFFKLKNDLLSFEIQRSGQHPARWEKKGSSLYTIKNVQKYPELRRSTFRLLNKIESLGGFVIYVGLQKKTTPEKHDPKKLYHAVLREVIKRLDQECEQKSAQLLIVLDQQEDRVMRPAIVQNAACEMFGQSQRKALIEPPIQAESHLYQTIQCADWICGIVGRLSHYECEKASVSDYEAIEKYFKNRLDLLAKRSSIKKII